MGIKSRDNPIEETAMEAALRKAGLVKETPAVESKPRTAIQPEVASAEKEQPALVAPKENAVEVKQVVAEQPVVPTAQLQHQPLQNAARTTASVAPITNKGNTMTQQNTTTLGERLSSRLKPISRGTSSARAGELSRAIQKAISEGFGQSPFAKGWNVQVLDHSNGLSFPVIMLTWRQQDDIGNARVAAFGLLIEPEDQRLSPRVEKFDQTTFEIITTLGDVYNSAEFAGVVETSIRRVQKLEPGDAISHAGGLRVPASAALSETLISELAFQAVTACFAIMDRYIAVNDEHPFTLLNRDMRNERLIGRLKVSNKPFINELGEPIRADLIASVDSSRQGGSLMLGDTNISTMMGYCEPVYSQPSTDPTKPRPPFYPMLVITNVQAGSDQSDLESLLLSLVNGVQLISYRNAWADSFRRRAGGSSMHDVGALGLLTPAGERINTKTDEFKAMFDSFMREYFDCNSGMVVAIDIADIGPNAWAMDVFKACAAGIPTAIKAFEIAMDNLTGGAYSKLAAQAGILGQSPVTAHGDRRHAGHYNDSERGLCDIRDVDLLAVSNAHGNNTMPVETYVESTVPMRGTDNTRAAERYQCIDDVLQGRQVVTGYYTRLYFAPNALPVMARACEAAKLIIQPSHMVHGLGSAQRMGGYDFAGLLSNSNGGQLFGAGASASTPTSRW